MGKLLLKFNNNNHTYHKTTLTLFGGHNFMLFDQMQTPDLLDVSKNEHRYFVI